LATYGPSALKVGRFSIGLNPVMKQDDAKAYYPTTAAGVVYLGSGTNALYGGQTSAPGGYSFPIANATVEVDGKMVVRNGQLVSTAIASTMTAPKKSRK